MAIVMCGIAGILALDLKHPAERERLSSMIGKLRHRGPDGEGLYLDGPVGLAHRRLAIIDLVTGDQPMRSADGRLTIVFNGEIYNYLELRQELEDLGREFSTSSDTEVLLAAYAEWGVGFHNKLNGIWAFALWDRDEHTLVLSRDRLGEKPLHYAEWNGQVVFGSEIKCLFESGLPAEADLESLEIFLTFGYVPAPYSLYRRIRKVRPGHYMIARGGRLEERCYWTLPLSSEEAMRRDRYSIDEVFADLLQDSVRLRMRSDVPFGAFLSGGLDSSSIVALMLAPV